MNKSPNQKMFGLSREEPLVKRCYHKPFLGKLGMVSSLTLGGSIEPGFIQPGYPPPWLMDEPEQ